MENTTVQRERAFDIAVNEQDGTVLLTIQKGILGSMSKQLKNTNDFRKGATILRKMGFDLAAAGDQLYKTEKQDAENSE